MLHSFVEAMLWYLLLTCRKKTKMACQTWVDVISATYYWEIANALLV
ncbi:hypothetical protein [Bacillus sp. JJ1609]